MARLSLWSLALLALIAICAQAQAQTAPVAGDNTIEVYVTATADNPYVFEKNDFPFEDDDKHAFARVDLGSVPTVGTLRTGAVASAMGHQFYANPTGSQSGFSDLTYYPAPGQSPTEGYASFTFGVRDSSGALSHALATITIDLVRAPQLPATGAPAVTAPMGSTAWHEDVTLTASIGTVRDANGISTDTIAWQWEHAAAPASGIPATSAYAAIAGADDDTFTPLQDHVGDYVRVCVSFMDNFMVPGDERRCTAGNVIVNVNDAPASADAFVNVPITATADMPFYFSAGHFAFMDEDVGDNADFESVSISLPGRSNIAGTLRLGAEPGFARGTATSVNFDDIATLNFYPNTDQQATTAYSTFSFAVYDGATYSEIHTMTINLVPADIRLRLRLFLEGPLR